MSDPLKLAKDVVLLRNALQAALDAIDELHEVIHADENEMDPETAYNLATEKINKAIADGQEVLALTGARH